MQKVNLFKVVGLLILASTLFFVTKSFACVGARPLAMGGAFVAVADDVNAVYWNPAGLTQIKKAETTLMHTVNNRKAINYQNFYGFAQSSKDVSVGIGYIHSIPIQVEGEEFAPGIEWGKFAYDQKLYNFSLSKKLNEKMSLGITVRQNKEKIEAEILTDEYEYYKDSATGDVMSIDLGYLYKIDEKLSIGLLVQDVNKPKVKFKFQEDDLLEYLEEEWGVPREIEHLRNIRTGFAYRPTENILVAADIYYFTLDNVYDEDVKGQSDVRWGMEFLANENWALRFGRYGDAFNTLGFGYKKNGFQIDYALLSSYGEFGTHILSAKFQLGREKTTYKKEKVKEKEVEEIKCSKCNTLNPKENIFCEECGTKIR